MTEKSKTIVFQVDICIEPDEDGFHAHCPALKGLHVCGETEAEAMEAAKDAVIAYVQSLIKHGDPIPLGTMQIPDAKRECSDSAHYHRELLPLATA
jgi:predicted RNase H-like HicB family nuclease